MKTNHITIITTGLVIILAILSFILSYASLQHMAEINGVDGWLSYVWPLLLDFAMMIFAMAILRVNLRNDRGSWYPWVLTIVFAGLATLSNVLDVSTFGIPAMYIQIGVKALPPISLTLSFHLLMEMVKSEVERNKLEFDIADLTVRRQELDSQVGTLASKYDTLKNDIVELRKAKITANDKAFELGDMDSLDLANETRHAQIVDRRKRVNELLVQQMTHSDIANELAVSISTVRRDVAALNGSGVVVA